MFVSPGLAVVPGQERTDLALAMPIHDGGEGLGGCADGVAGAKRSSVGMGEAGAGEAAGGGCSPSSKKARQ